METPDEVSTSVDSSASGSSLPRPPGAGRVISDIPQSMNTRQVRKSVHPVSGTSHQVEVCPAVDRVVIAAVAAAGVVDIVGIVDSGVVGVAVGIVEAVVVVVWVLVDKA